MEHRYFKFSLSDFELGFSPDSSAFIIRNSSGIFIYDDIDEFLSDTKSFILKLQELNNKK